MEAAGVWQQEWQRLWATGLNMAANSKERVYGSCVAKQGACRPDTVQAQHVAHALLHRAGS